MFCIKKKTPSATGFIRAKVVDDGIHDIDAGRKWLRLQAHGLDSDIFKIHFPTGVGRFGDPMHL